MSVTSLAAKAERLRHEKKMKAQTESRRRKAKEKADLFLEKQMSEGLALNLDRPGAEELHANLQTMFESTEVTQYVEDMPELTEYEMEEKEIATLLFEYRPIS